MSCLTVGVALDAEMGRALDIDLPLKRSGVSVILVAEPLRRSGFDQFDRDKQRPDWMHASQPKLCI